ncbi:MAG: ABC transporter substrate-binding protein [Acidimicrobiia bacterium]|nr:ABC transporter substrate-binding protein [Acidimicrobiia bacterium]
MTLILRRPLRSFVLSLAILAALAVLRTAGSAQAPTRIISLVPALTEILFAIGAGSQVVAVSSYDDYPPEVLGLPRVGALLDPNTERILALRPDLVLTYGSQDALQAQLARAGISVFDYRHGGLADITREMRRLGAAAGRTADAERVATGLEQRLDAVRSRTRGRARPRTLLVMGREPGTLRNLNASGGVGFLHDVLELAGATNLFADVPRQAVTVSNEMLLSRAPEVIIDLRYGNAQTPDRDAWTAVSSIPAVKQGRVYDLHGDQFVVPGPRIADAAEAMARAIHPEAFP